MGKKPPYIMTPFDSLVTNELLQMIKLMLPYMPPSLQRMAGTYAKFSEFQNAIYYFQPPYYHSRRGRLRQKEFTVTSIFEDLAPYLPEDAAQMMDSFSQAMSMMKAMEFAEGGEGEGMDFSEMAKQMLTPEQQAMFDMMETFQSERTDQNERVDEQPGNEESGPGETGAD